MKVALLSPYSEISAIGIRTISAYLKSNGISTRLIFLPLQKSFYSREAFSTYPDASIDKIAELVKDTDIIGISFMTNFYFSIRDLTLKLKKRFPHKPVVWGGIHPTVMPEQSMSVADYVCIGEGEISFLELCRHLTDKKAADDIPGIWAKKDGQIIKNQPTNVIIDLDQIPAQDYDLEDDYILLSKKEIVRITKKNIRQFLGVTYWTMYTRGCPYSCTYCCNDALRKINKDFTKIRAKTPETMVREILTIQEKYPFVEYINFQDDTFFALPEKDILKFSEYYKQKVSLPFLIPGVHPSAFTEKKYACLVESGMLRIRMGIQSGSRRIMEEIYKRKQDNNKVIEISRIIQKHSKKLMMPNYDIIVDNPWETKEDKLQTIDLLSKLAPPYSVNTYSLQFFPGTRLYEKGLEEKIITEDSQYKPYYNVEPNYLNLIIMFYSVFKIPSWLLKRLLSKKLINSENQFPRFHNFVYKLMLYRRGAASIFSRDYSMFPPGLQFLFCRILPPHKRLR